MSIKEEIFSIKNKKKYKQIKFLGIRLRIKRNIKEDPYLSIGNENLRYINEVVYPRYEIIHLIHTTSFSVELVDFLEKIVDHNKHLFIFKSGPYNNNTTLIYDNVIEADLNKVKIDLSFTKKIIIYSLLNRKDILYFYRNCQLLKKSYWLIFGGDLYNTRDDFCSSYVKSNVKAILTVFDKDEYYKRFGYKKCYNIIFPHPFFKDVKFLSQEKNTVNILVNHCVDYSTPTILKQLEKFKNFNIKIHCPISYTTIGQNCIRDEIISTGREIFGDKIIFYPNWVDEDSYKKLLENISIFLSGVESLNSNQVGRLSAVGQNLS